jgi:hypothetical protein
MADARPVLGVQAAYYLGTGVTPFVSRRLFEAVTGPKTDWWLVQTVGGLVCAVGAGLACAVANDRVTPEITGIAVGSASVLAAADVWFVGRGTIARSYLLDAVVEAALVTALLRARRSVPA